MSEIETTKLAQKLVELARNLQPSVSSNGRQVVIRSGNQTITLNQLRNSQIQEQVARFR